MIPEDAKPIINFDDSFDGRTDTLHENVVPLCPHCGEWSCYTTRESEECGGYTICPFCEGKMFMPCDFSKEAPCDNCGECTMNSHIAETL